MPRVRTFTFLGGSGWAHGKGVPFAQLAPSLPPMVTDVTIGILALTGNLLTLALVELGLRVRR